MKLDSRVLLSLLALGAVAMAGCTTAPPSQPALVQQMHDAYVDRPFMGGQGTPDHEWAVVDSGRTQLAFLHWMDKDAKGQATGGDPEKADVLFATGDGQKGRWCLGSEGILQKEIDAGYVHFHKETSANWDAGHGGTGPAQVGYWLRHVAAINGVAMMPGVVSKAGQVYPLMPSTAGLPSC